MEYLRKLFHGYLNSAGSVEIEGYEFYRDAILKGMEPEGYNQAFDEWLVTRQGDNLATANRILSRFDNNSRFERLKTIYRSGAVIPFAGAGMSMSSGYSSWTDFLYSLLPDTDIAPDEFNILLRSGQYEEAAQKIHDSMPHGCFSERVENEFCNDKDLEGPIQRFPQIFKTAVVTTNFDSVIKRSYEELEQPFDEVITGADAIRLPRLLGQNRRVLVKLHGHANSSRGRILTRAEYDRHYTAEATLENTIEALSNQTLLFVGCSLSIDRTVQALTKIVQKKGVENVPRHYAFLQLQDESKRLERRNLLAAANIFPIWYTEDHDESIEALLEKLTEGKS